MVLSEHELRELLIQNQVSVQSFKLLWEVDSEKVYELTVLEEDAIAQWNHLRQIVDKLRHYPLLLGSEEGMSWHHQCVDSYGAFSWYFWWD